MAASCAAATRAWRCCSRSAATTGCWTARRVRPSQPADERGMGAMSVPLLQKIAADFAAVAPAARRAGNQHALDQLTLQGLPGARDENWKYVNLRVLDKLQFAPPPRAAVHLDAAQLPAPIAGYARYTFVDGVLCPALSAPLRIEGVSVRSMSESEASGTDGSGNGRGHGAGSTAVPPALSCDLRFALLNEAFATDGALISVGPGTQCPACVELLFVATAEGRSAASYPRVRLQVGAGARFGLIERHVSAVSDSSFINSSVEVHLARDAQLRHFRIQQCGARATCLGTLTAALAENAAYQCYGIGLGGQLARSTLQLRLLGRNAAA